MRGRPSWIKSSTQPKRSKKLSPRESTLSNSRAKSQWTTWNPFWTTRCLSKGSRSWIWSLISRFRWTGAAKSWGFQTPVYPPRSICTVLAGSWSWCLSIWWSTICILETLEMILFSRTLLTFSKIQLTAGSGFSKCKIHLFWTTKEAKLRKAALWGRTPLWPTGR